MNTKHQAFSKVFACIFIAMLLVEYFDYQAIRIIIKPLVMLSLIVYFVKKVAFLEKWILFSLIASCVGDVLLMFTDKSPHFFTAGLASFLLAHLGYCRAFSKDFPSGKALKNKVGILVFLGSIVFAICFYTMLYANLNEMKVPVLVYVATIVMMATFAAFRYGQATQKSFLWVLFGAFFFLISDSTLGYDKFLHHFSGAGIVIMATYMLAQYCITIGILERRNQ